MSQHQFFRRQPVPPQAAQQLQTITFPAPTRGIVQNENESYMQPGAAVVCDNWKPTMKGVSLRGGCDRWAELPETTPVISAFEYASGVNHKMFAANATKLYDVTTSDPGHWSPVGRTSGNYVASQLANQGGDFMLVANDAGDPLLRYNGTTWTSLTTTTPATWSVSTPYAVDAAGARQRRQLALEMRRRAHQSRHRHVRGRPHRHTRAAGWWTWPPDSNSWITGPAGSPVENGGNLTYVCKYRNRYFFIERNR